MKRIQGTVPPCHRCPKIPASVPVKDRNWNNAVEWTPQLVRLRDYLRKCEATGRWPESDLTDEFAVAWMRLQQRIERERRRREINLLVQARNSDG